VPTPAASLLNTIQLVINNTVAFPLTGTAVAPDLVGISMSTTITLAGSVSASDQTSVLSAAVAAVQTYINNLAINSPLVINEIATQIFNADTRISDVGNPNDEILEILIWRSRSDGTRYSRYLIGDYQPAFGERIIVENSTAVAVPINLSVS
jgi:hypothetical protein